MKDKLNLTLGAFDKQRFELEEIRQNLDVVFEGVQIAAAITRVKFLNLVERGFTEAQALELCK